MDKGETPINIYLDLSKAFDTLNHDILLSKLQLYGIKNMPLKLISNYLFNRTQYVHFNGINSEMYPVQVGVPQGSILGPLLFIIYLNDLPNACKLFQPIIYADDNTLYGSLKCFGDLNEKSISENINNELQDINTWLKLNKLSLNTSKTKYIVFHMPQKKIPKLELKLDDKLIEQVSDFNLLGVHINQHLNWSTHTNYINTKISKTIGILSKLKHFLPRFVLKIIYDTLIVPHLTYGILCWGHSAKKTFILQKKCLRIISNSKYNAHTDPIFKQFSLLKLQDIYKLEILKFCFKLENSKLPLYFNSINTQNVASLHQHNTRSRNAIYLHKTRHNFADNSISQIVPKTLNETDNLITDKIHTHSLKGYSLYIKNKYIGNYSDNCEIRNCYICSKK